VHINSHSRYLFGVLSVLIV